MAECVTIGARWTCEQCGIGFDREKSGTRPIRFCSQPCYHIWNRAHGSNSGRFSKGAAPWNKNMKGIHLSPHSEWKKGCESDKKLPVGSETIRYRAREGKARAFVKVAEPAVWKERAIVVWEKHHGRKVPSGFVVHHKDRNPLNDDPSNLEALSRADHIAEHRKELRAAS